MKFVILILNWWLEQSSFKFVFTKVTKVGGKGNLFNEVSEYSDDEKLCTVFCFDEHFGRYVPWHTQGQNQLYLSHIKLYKEVQSYTIVNWVKVVLKMAGIYTSLYKAHSCRSAPTSKAKVLGVSLKGQWSGASTWQRHCNKEIVNTRKSSEFETVILNNILI